MKRRKFLIGTGSATIGGATIVGSGAFTQVESHRVANVQVVDDENAYLGLSPGDSPNGDNYVEKDDNGHIEIDIDENPNSGEGVNSNSLTFFDSLINVCNQGKEDTALFIDATNLDTGDSEVVFYAGSGTSTGDTGITSITEAAGVDQFEPVELELGQCIDVGLLIDTGAGSSITNAETVNANQDELLVEGEIKIVADVEVDTGEATALLSNLDIDGQGSTATITTEQEFDVSVLVTNTGQRSSTFSITFNLSRNLDREEVKSSLFETGAGIEDPDVEEPSQNNTKIGFGRAAVDEAYNTLTAD